jgi:hypothetical protein
MYISNKQQKTEAEWMNAVAKKQSYSRKWKTNKSKFEK